jgi:hypothetical protein
MFDLNTALEAVTAVAVLGTAWIGRANGRKSDAIQTQADAIHNEVRSTNGQTTAQNVENIGTQLAQNPNTPIQPHGNRREDV